jgi:hypothetical protein
VFIVVKKKHVFVSAMIDSMAWMIALHDTWCPSSFFRSKHIQYDNTW